MLQQTNFDKICENQFRTKRLLLKMLKETKERISHINFSNILQSVIVSVRQNCITVSQRPMDDGYSKAY